MTKDLKVLYVEDNPKDAENYGEIWKSLFREHGFPNVDFRTSSRFDLELVDEQLPHVVIADNVLVSADGAEELDNEGAQFLADLKSTYKHIVCILFTRATFSIKTLGQLTPNPDLLVPKTHFRSPEYQEDWVGPQINHLLSRRPIGTLVLEPPSTMSEYRDLTSAINCILEQCLNDVSSHELGLTAQIKLSKLTGGASGASVFLTEVSGIERFHNVPLVFRISAKKYIFEEVANYKRFVSLQVPHDLRVELLGYGEHLDYGGALYAFALADVANTTTALSTLKDGDIDRSKVLRDILDRIFARENLGWYNSDGNGTVELAEYFSEREEYNQKKDHRRIRGISANLKKFGLGAFSIDGDYLSDGQRRFPLPRNIMEKLSGVEVQLAVAHGDLNLNNIIVSNDDQRLALIDFEYCGIDHVFKDFVSLEVSALDLFDGHDDFEYAFSHFRKVHGFRNFWVDEGELIGVVRSAALAKVTGATPSPEVSYLLCLAFHLFKVAALENIGKAHFVAMFASMCAALEKLDEVAVK